MEIIGMAQGREGAADFSTFGAWSMSPIGMIQELPDSSAKQTLVGPMEPGVCVVVYGEDRPVPVVQ